MITYGCHFLPLSFLILWTLRVGVAWSITSNALIGFRPTIACWYRTINFCLASTERPVVTWNLASFFSGFGFSHFFKANNGLFVQIQLFAGFLFHVFLLFFF
jgi:hypothetical protein